MSNLNSVDNVLSFLNGGFQNVVKEEINGNVDFYVPDPKKAKGGVVSLMLRAVPNINNPENSLVDRLQYFIPDTREGGKFTVLSPKSLNPKAKCKVAFTYFPLFKSKQAGVKEYVKEAIGYRKDTIGLFQVIDCTEDASLAGRYIIIQIPKEIKTAFKLKTNPIDGEKVMDKSTGKMVQATPENIYDFWAGEIFKLTVGVEKYTNQQGEPAEKRSWAIDWQGVKVPLSFNNEPIQEKPTEHEAYVGVVRDIIEKLNGDDVPNLESYSYKPWDEELTTRVTESMNLVKSGKWKKEEVNFGGDAKDEQATKPEVAPTEQTTENESGESPQNQEVVKDSPDTTVMSDDDANFMREVTA